MKITSTKQLNRIPYTTTFDKRVSPIKNSYQKVEYGYNIVFTGVQNMGVVSTKVNLQKSKMLNMFKEILASEKIYKTPEELKEARNKRALNVLRYKLKKHNELSKEADAIMSKGQYRALCREDKFKLEFILEELKKLTKIPLYEEPKKSKYDSEDFDFKLINLFQKEVSNDNFNLRLVYTDYYKGLEDIKTVDELKTNFPDIKLPKNPIDVAAKKIVSTIPREIYEEYQEMENNNIPQPIIKEKVGTKVAALITKILYQYDLNNNTIVTVGKKAIELFQNTFWDYSAKNKIKLIPQKVDITNVLSKTDIELLNIDYDAFILTVIKEHYINDKKLNDITYQENGKIFKVSDYKESEYKFEKKSEKIKKIVTDAEKIKATQRDYLKYTNDELKQRLEYFGNSKYGSNEDLLNLLCEFHACKFVNEDRGYIVKLLTTLDKLFDCELDLNATLKYLKDNNIKPIGTHKVNEIEQQEIKERLWKEHLLSQTLTKAQEEYFNTINELYAKNLSSLAEICTKFYPKKADYAEIISSLIVIKFIEETLNSSQDAQNKILRWETFLDYETSESNSEIFKEALKYGVKNSREENQNNILNTIQKYVSEFLPEHIDTGNYQSLFEVLNNIELKEKTGQYLLNRNVIEGYPGSKDLVPYPEILDKIMENFGHDKNLATEYLCKYHDYYSLDSENKSFISNILNIFDLKNNNNKILLKEIIENDFINSDTYIYVNEGTVPKKRTIASIAKREIYDKHNFPNSILYFEKFEDAFPQNARSEKSAGVKKVDRNNKKSLYRSEVKIIGYDDRLVADNNDYYFNHYLPEGLH